MKSLENTVTSFFFYMWNAWCEEECRIVFGKGNYLHFWRKWCSLTLPTSHGAAENFYKELSTENRSRLVNRACKLYEGNRCRISDCGLYHCEKCGSIDIQFLTWEYLRDETNYKQGRCEYCGEIVPIVSHNKFMEQVEDWWEEVDGEDAEVVTGLNQEDFNPDNDYQEFIDACNKHWKSLSDEEKITIWKTMRHGEEYPDNG